MQEAGGEDFPDASPGAGSFERAGGDGEIDEEGAGFGGAVAARASVTPAARMARLAATAMSAVDRCSRPGTGMLGLLHNRGARRAQDQRSPEGSGSKKSGGLESQRSPEGSGIRARRARESKKEEQRPESIPRGEICGEVEERTCRRGDHGRGDRRLVRFRGVRLQS